MKGILGGAIAAFVAIAGATAAHAASIQVRMDGADTGALHLGAVDVLGSTTPLGASVRIGAPGAANAVLGMATMFDGAADTSTNDAWHDLVVRGQGEESSFGSGSFVWTAAERGDDAFALASAGASESGSMTFLDVGGRGLDNAATSQFITWSNGDWPVFSDGSFARGGSFAAVPLPPALGLGLVGLGTLLAGRKLKKSKRAAA